MPGVLRSTTHFPEIMLNLITSDVPVFTEGRHDGEAIPLMRDRWCPLTKAPLLLRSRMANVELDRVG
ncbi:MAG: hypothetical protein WBB32_11645 [Flavobacteriales bacterium]